MPKSTDIDLNDEFGDFGAFEDPKKKPSKGGDDFDDIDLMPRSDSAGKKTAASNSSFIDDEDFRFGGAQKEAKKKTPQVAVESSGFGDDFDDDEVVEQTHPRVDREIFSKKRPPIEEGEDEDTQMMGLEGDEEDDHDHASNIGRNEEIEEEEEGDGEEETDEHEKEDSGIKGAMLKYGFNGLIAAVVAVSGYFIWTNVPIPFVNNLSPSVQAPANNAQALTPPSSANAQPAVQVKIPGPSIPPAVNSKPATQEVLPQVNPVQNFVDKGNLERIAGIEAQVSDLKEKIKDIKTDGLQAKFATIEDRIGKLEGTLNEINDKLNNRTQSQTSQVPLKPAVLDGWVLKGANKNTAWVDGPAGMMQVSPGTVLPGGGTVERIQKYNDEYYVVTTTGIIKR